MSKKLLITLITAVAVLGSTSGYLVAKLTIKPEQVVVEHPVSDCGNFNEERGGGYDYINPLLECDNYHASELNSVVELETKVKAYIQQAQSDGKASFVSVYYRDLNFGPWMGINEKENFSPASLLKLPILIAALKKAETEPGLLYKKVAYTHHLDADVRPNIVEKNQIVLGHTYTVQELLNHMIKNSDNEAKAAVLQIIGVDYVVKVMKDIGVNSEADQSKDFVSVKDYSNFFRLLYNATYLSRDMSELALTILTGVDYTEGLRAGVPQGVKIAHKFGERGFIDSDAKQLHDCGIVYLNNSPYLICVMTRGKDFKELSSVIAGISGIVYQTTSESTK